jgi:hypothetical protein
MYRKILGDCFLLTHRFDGRTFHALIDCGALQSIGKKGQKPNTDSSLAQLGAAIDDLLEATAGKIDLVIATHEHYDHLSGFMKYHGKFANLAIEQVWLAWTENDADEVALAIREKRWEAVKALTALVGADDRSSGLRAFGVDLDPESNDKASAEIRSQVDTIRNLLQFQGSLPDPDNGDAAPPAAAMERVKFVEKRPASCAAALDWLKGKATNGAVTYLTPGEQVSFGLDRRLLAHVLGPPRSLARLRQMDPSGDPKKKEVYLTDQDDFDSLLATLSNRYDPAKVRNAMAVDGAEELNSDVEIFIPVDPDQPFDKRHARWPVEERIPEKEKARLRQIKEEKQFDLPDPVSNRYYHPDHSSRRIDGDWLGVAATLGLKVDDDVNNTSLALAIEVPGRHVLLFPADAQVGNWLSWHDQTYPSKPGVKVEKGETAADILSRVVLYKVGHHGSHNATAKALGLELMTSPHLAAMIPVVEDVAKEQKTSSNPDGWAMPYDDLYARLKAKTAQRILRGDGKVAEEREAFINGLFSLNYAKDQADDPAWVSLTLPRR